MKEKKLKISIPFAGLVALVVINGLFIFSGFTRALLYWPLLGALFVFKSKKWLYLSLGVIGMAMAILFSFRLAMNLGWNNITLMQSLKSNQECLVYTWIIITNTIIFLLAMWRVVQLNTNKKMS